MISKSSKRVTLRTGCKINLHLEITGIKENGYHELDTLFYPLPKPFDTLSIAPAAAGSGLNLDCPAISLSQERNIIHKAWKKYGEATEYIPDLTVSVEKGIPDGAGLGGGSSDAAAILNYLNTTTTNSPLSSTELNSLAAELGADVPFFLDNIPAHATGIGEILTPSDISLKGMSLVLICPNIKVPTPWAFKAWDEAYNKNLLPENKKEFLTSSTPEDRKHSSRALWLFNSFEVVVYSAFPKLRAYKEKLLTSGACGAMLSGSGSSIFALYREMETANRAAAALQAESVATYLHHL